MSLKNSLTSSRIRKEIMMSKCKDCKYCDQEKLERKTWYCDRTDILLSAVTKYDLPYDSEHSEYCFEKRG